MVDLIEEVTQLLPRLAAAERDYARAVARELGLAPIDLYALGDLLSGEPAGVVEVGRRLGLGSAAATGLADRLEAAGHVTREPHPNDRRRLVLTPTSSARAELFALLGAITRDTRHLADDFDEAELQAVARFLRAVVELYERHSTASRTG